MIFSDRWAQATDTLGIKIAGDVVWVGDVDDESLCTARAWSEAKAQLQRQEPVGGDDAVAEARADLWRAVVAPIISSYRGDRGSYEARRRLASDARDAGMLPEWAKGLVR
jgi:hypothetical protein